MNTEPDWEQARELFLDLADLPEAQRQRELAQLDETSPELADWVRALLQHDREETSSVGAPAPRRFGPYEEVRPVGRGGMGEVFVARRVDGEYEREVAIKLLRTGTANAEFVHRFLRERQTLARLDHEYIAHLLDGGTTPAGEPYLVMEYVDGEPADTFAARLELGERIELFTRIGQAVAHAHERGFVHRDLKPSNILVRPDGTPRLLDFGIARPYADESEDDQTLTRTGQRLFTPEYASPEQVRGETATTRSDIFALGVLLYVFVCGRKPWGESKSLHELEVKICRDDPTPPGRLVTGTGRGRVAGDLDAVVLQCLAKEPHLRYASVRDLCDDLEAYLAGRPIQARRTGTLGRALRLARRKPGYPVGAALGLAALAAGWFAWDSERRGERQRGELIAAISDRMETARARWFDGDMAAGDAELQTALASLRELPEEHQLLADVLVRKARFANGWSDWDASFELLERAELALQEVDVPDPEIVGALLNTRMFALQGSEQFDRSPAASRLALEHAREHFGRGHELRIDALVGWTHELQRSGDVDQALEVLTQTISEARKREEESNRLSISLQEQAGRLTGSGQPDMAAQATAQALREARDRDATSQLISRLLNQQAVALANIGRYEEAVTNYREALAIFARHRGERHPGFAKMRLNLGSTLFRLGRFEEARVEHEQSLALCRLNRDLEQFVAANLHFLGRIHCAQGDLAAAEVAAREAIDIREFHELGVHTDRSRCLLGIVQALDGRPDDARATLEPVLGRAEPGALLPDMEAQARHLLGAILDDYEEDEAARPHLERALQLKREALGPTHDDCLDLSARLAELR